MIAVAGDLADAESMVALKDLFNRLGSGNLQTCEDLPVNTDLRSNYLFNSTIAGIEDADVVLMVGTNPRMESPLINARMRKAQRLNGQKAYAIGPAMNLAMDHQNLGNRTQLISEIADKRHKFAATLAKAKKPMIIIGVGALTRKDGKHILAAVKELSKQFPNLSQPDWNGINILNTASSKVAAYDIGFRQGLRKPSSNPKFIYLLGADEIQADRIPKDAFVVYQGHHGDAGANRANVVLPGAAYTEKVGTYVNVEGRVQHTAPALNPLELAREDWKIIRALSEVLGKPLPYDTTEEVQARLADVAPHFARLHTVEKTSGVVQHSDATAKFEDSVFQPYLSNFYMTNPISRSSRIMAKASQMLKNSRNSYLDSSHLQASSL
jgi:NADH dehydrogenase (ubiquinone) Fe-S protein 1